MFKYRKHLIHVCNASSEAVKCDYHSIICNKVENIYFYYKML